MFTDDAGNFRLGRLTVLCAGILCFGVLVMAIARHDIAGASASTPAEAHHSTSTYVATQTCEDWTRKHARLGVGEMIGDRRVDDKRDGYFRIVLNWRSQGDGLLMASECRFVDKGKLFAMLGAESGLAK